MAVEVARLWPLSNIIPTHSQHAWILISVIDLLICMSHE
jgi:hypothetical protein